jgi:hypothetical protein
MADKTRIYAIRMRGTVVALVEAANKSQAMAHHAQSTWGIGVATPNELISATQAGIKVDNAAAEPEPVREPQGVAA